jgi:hypothetical protein
MDDEIYLTNPKKWFSKFEIEFVHTFLKYISHCSDIDYVKSIMNDTQLRVKNRDISGYDPIVYSKIFCRVDDKYLDDFNKYCSDNSGVEFILDKELLLKHKYYVIHEPGSFGNLGDVIYISPFLFNIIKESDFDKTKFKANIENMNLSDKMIVSTLLEEVDSFFDCRVIKQKYNPPITSSLIFAIQFRELSKNPQYGVTVAFLGHIDLVSTNLKKINIADDMDEYDYYVQKRAEFIETLKNKNIKYEFKSFVRVKKPNP